MLPLPWRLSNLALSATSISYRKELSKAKPWMPPAHTWRGRSIQVQRYLVQPVGGRPLPPFEAARAALARVLPRIAFDLGALVTLGSNGRGALLLDVPEDRHTESVVSAFLDALDALAA